MLFMLSAVPASAQYWGVPGSAGDIDDASETLFDTDGPTLKFKSGATGTIVARDPVYSSALDPGWTDLAVNYSGAGVSAKLIGLIHCNKFPDQIAAETFPTGESNSCEGISVPAGTWDFSQWTFYVEVTLTRSSTATDPQVHQLHFQ